MENYILVNKLEPKTFMGERRRSWASNDLCVDLSHYSAGCSLSKHQHRDAFYCFVLNGGFEENANGRSEVFSSGALVYHSPGCEHSNQWHLAGRCLHVELGDSYFEGVKRTTLTEPPLRNINGRACDVVRRIYLELLHVDTTSNLAFEGLALLLLAETIRESDRESTAPRWLQGVRDRLQDDYIAVSSLHQLAISAGVHPTHLATSFQKHFGVSIGEFVRSRRVERAQEILAETDMPLDRKSVV